MLIAPASKIALAAAASFLSTASQKACSVAPEQPRVQAASETVATDRIGRSTGADVSWAVLHEGTGPFAFRRGLTQTG